MPSAFGWLDFAESDRQRAMQVIDLFREKGTVDELGFAPIRDAFADHFFPGTSTIQTRARYFLFVPWIIQEFSQAKLGVEEFKRKVHRRESDLMKSLLAGGEEQEGIIGREALDTLKRMPSSVYWRGLNLWGIRLFEGSLEKYARRLSRQSCGDDIATDDGEPLGRTVANWHPQLPEKPVDLYDSASLELVIDEAEFLRDRICSTQPNSLLARLVSAATAELDAEYAWDIPRELIARDGLVAALEEARRFALCSWGAQLAYTLMVAELKKNEVLVAAAAQALQGWVEQISENAPVLTAWNRDSLWELVRHINPRVSIRTQNFAEEWIKIALRAGPATPVWQEPGVRNVVIQREADLKGPRARLRPDNLRARDQWRGDPRTGPMDFRWGRTKSIVNDIIRGYMAANRR